jgi:hypothetical protein
MFLESSYDIIMIICAHALLIILGYKLFSIVTRDLTVMLGNAKR